MSSNNRARIWDIVVCGLLLLAGIRSAWGQSASPLTVTGTANSQIKMIKTNSPTRTWSFFANNNVFDINDGVQSPFQIEAGAPSVSLKIASTGRTLFGRGSGANPERSLHVIDTDMPALRLQQINPAQTYDLEGSELGFKIIDVTNANTIPFLITPTGNVGLGAIAPAGHLHVNGAGSQLSIFQSSDNNPVQLRLQTNSINRRVVALNAAGQLQSQLAFGDSGAFDFLGATASDVRMRCLANGNVGIGTTSPDQKLSVNGNASKPGGGSWATFSDERLKDIRGEFTSGLDAVMKLQPIRYKYKADNAIGLQSDGEHIGFGAAAMSKVIPEAVSRNEDGYLMIDNDPILWTMLNAIKEQSAQMKEQKAEIEQLKARDKEIAQLKVQLERLQALVVLQAGNPSPAGKESVAQTSH